MAGKPAFRKDNEARPLLACFLDEADGLFQRRTKVEVVRRVLQYHARLHGGCPELGKVVVVEHRSPSEPRRVSYAAAAKPAVGGGLRCGLAVLLGSEDLLGVGYALSRTLEVKVRG